MIQFIKKKKMFVSIRSLETKVWNLCLVKKRAKDYPATVVGAIYYKNWFIVDSGFPPPPIAIQLRQRLETRLGPIGTELNGNIIGKCAEVGAANKILRTRPTVPADKIVFTSAIRPRTMQTISMCINCVKTFK